MKHDSRRALIHTCGVIVIQASTHYAMANLTQLELETEIEHRKHHIK